MECARVIVIENQTVRSSSCRRFRWAGQQCGIPEGTTGRLGGCYCDARRRRVILITQQWIARVQWTAKGGRRLTGHGEHEDNSGGNGQ